MCVRFAQVDLSEAPVNGGASVESVLVLRVQRCAPRENGGAFALRDGMVSPSTSR